MKRMMDDGQWTMRRSTEDDEQWEGIKTRTTGDEEDDGRRTMDNEEDDRG